MGPQNSKIPRKGDKDNNTVQDEEEEVQSEPDSNNSSNESSSIESSDNEEYLTSHDSNLVKVTFNWDHGGNEVFLIGSFNSWKERIRLEKTDHGFTLEKLLDRSMIHEYKFIVDNEWRFAHEQPTVKDQHGNINNWVDTAAFPEFVENANQNKFSDIYSQEMRHDFMSMEPEPLPLHLKHVLANHSESFDYRERQVIPPNSIIRETNAELAGENHLPVCELPVPPHVILNHIGVRVDHRYIGLTVSQRFREKFVTTIYCKPIHSS